MKNTSKNGIIQPFPSFDYFLEKAKCRIGKFSQKRQNELKDMLNHGKAYLNNSDLLDMYLCCYGDIHRKKLLMAYKQFPSSIFYNDGISVIDYACGQGIAELVLVDYLVAIGIDRDYISDIYLIEPSKVCLNRAKNSINIQSPFTPAYIINSKLENVNYEDLVTKSNTIIHLFSNIIDIPVVNYDSTIGYLNNDTEHTNIVVCVSPFYQESGRGKRIPQFGDALTRYRLIYKLEKHIDDWDKKFSCQIYIYRSII